MVRTVRHDEQTTTIGAPIGAAMARAGASVRRALDGPAAAMVVVGMLLIASAWIAPAVLGPPSSSAVYSVAQVRDELAHAPWHLAGQTVWVRGVLQSTVTFPCAFTRGSCEGAEIRLTGEGRDSATGFPLVLEPAAPLALWLRRLPLVGGMSAVQQPRWGVIGSYQVRVQVRRVPGRTDEATLLASDVDLQSP